MTRPTVVMAACADCSSRTAWGGGGVNGGEVEGLMWGDVRCVM